MYACMHENCIFCSVTKAKEITMNPPLTRGMSKGRCKFTEKSSRVQNISLQPSRGNNKTGTQPEVKHVAIQTQCELTNTVTSTQTENAKFQDASLQTEQIDFEDTTSQTVKLKVNFKDISVQTTQNDEAAAIMKRYIHDAIYVHCDHAPTNLM